MKGAQGSLQPLHYMRHDKGRKCGRAGTSEVLCSYSLVELPLIPSCVLILEKTHTWP